MKILVISGSPTKKSRTRGLSNLVTEKLQDMNADVLNFDVGLDKLPLFTGSEDEQSNPTVQKLKSYASEADGFFVLTPEYHSGMSGALKNALDFLSGIYFKNKPITIAAAAGGGKGGINALNNLRLVLRGLYGLVLPGQFVADPAIFDDNYRVISEDAVERINSLVLEQVTLTKLIVAKEETLATS